MFDKSYPKSIHLAYPGSEYQIEVFHPSPAAGSEPRLLGPGQHHRLSRTPAAPPRVMSAEPASSLPGGRREPLRRLVWRLDTPAGLAAMFAVAFLVRVLIAPHAGFYGDLRLFQTWAGQLADVGTQRLLRSGPVRRLSAGIPLRPLADRQDLRDAGVPAAQAARDPCRPRPRLDRRNVRRADRSGFGHENGCRSARWSPQRVLFNPAVIALSAGWGQVDAVPAMFVLWSLLAALHRTRIRCGATSAPSSCSRSPSR